MAHAGQAYDLERFKPRETRLVALKNTKKVQEDARRRNRRQSVLNTLVYLLAGVMTLAIVGYFITCNVLTTELNQELLESQTRYSALKSEEVRLKSELASRTSAEEVNRFVLENGLLPLSSNQIYYVEAKEQDQGFVSTEQDNWFGQVWSAVTDIFA